MTGIPQEGRSDARDGVLCSNVPGCSGTSSYDAKNGLTLVLDHPISANRYWAVYRGRAVKTAAAKRYQSHVRDTARQAGLRIPLSGPVAVRIEYYRAKPVRSFDLDNVCKIALDSLNGIAWLDDKQITSINAEACGYRPGGALIVSWTPLYQL